MMTLYPDEQKMNLIEQMLPPQNAAIPGNGYSQRHLIRLAPSGTAGTWNSTDGIGEWRRALER